MSSSEPWITLGRDYNYCIEALQEKSKEIYIAKKDTQILGFIIIQMTGTFKGYIQIICVSSDYRGQGIGSLLIKFAEKRIFSETPNVFICVSSFNMKAHKLYNKLGYEDIGILKDFIIKGESEILLRKSIGSLNDFHPDSKT